MAHLLPWNTRSPFKKQSALLCVFQENNGVVTHIGRQSPQQLLKALTSILAVSLFPEVVDENYLL